MSQSPPLGELSAVKLALMARKAREQSARMLQADPIAIVGMACRAPGGADTPELLWRLVCEGRDAVREVPADRWDAAAWFDPDPSAVAKSFTRHGGFLDSIDGFDAPYFNLLPREAERMDPQQRLLLEVAIEAIDDAGITHERLRGTRSGVYIASYHNDYAALQYRDLDAVDARTLTGTLHSVLTNRLSYFLDLRGPSISIDTACSSSLVAVHLACQSLRSGETDLAIAGGVSLMISPDLMVSMSKVGFMAPDGRCKTFDARADGFGRGEGCGVIVIKRLADAIADSDRVLAVIRGSSVNSDGYSTLLAAPNGLAQQAMIKEALANAQLAPERIGYVEAHGTGTALGDPIEVEALAATVGRRLPGVGDCYLGSVKANLGHMEAAAGVTGLIKSVLVLQHQAIPPQVHFTKLNPHIALDQTRLAIPQSLLPWPASSQPRCAAVSSFGVGGTNAHVIIEEAIGEASASGAATTERCHILPLSARSPEALRALAAAWIPFLTQTTTSAADLCYTAAQRRSHYDCRLAVVAGDKTALRARLEDCLRDDAPLPGSSSPPRIAFVFSGQGPQWHAMGRELLAQEPLFRDVLTECDRRLRELAGWSLLDELGAAEANSRIGRTEIAQPAMFAIQAGVAALLRSWGMVPDAVCGHSVGEIAALHVAGALTLDEALQVVCRRGRIMQSADGLGRMASVAIGHEEAVELLRPHSGRLSVAAVNGPRSIVLSGDTGALDAVLAELAVRGVEHRMLPVRYAFHSAQMAPFQRRLADELQGLHPAAPGVPFYSTVTGTLADDQRLDGNYFASNMREPVLFARAISAMARDGCSAFVEIGPHPVLATSIAECLDAESRSATVVATLRRGRPEREALLQAAAGLYAVGWSPEWQALQTERGRIISLPGYPWQRSRHWIRPTPALVPGSLLDGRGGHPDPAPREHLRHPLLGYRIQVAASDAKIFQGSSAREMNWLADHRIFGRVPMPAAAVLETFSAAARAVTGAAHPAVKDLVMHRPMFLSQDGEPARQWQCSASVGNGENGGAMQLALHELVPAASYGDAAVASSEENEQWRVVATAILDEGPTQYPWRPEEGSFSQAIDSRDVLARFKQMAVEFGPHFQCLTELRRADGLAQGWLELPGDLREDAKAYGIHPVLLDGALQLCSIAAPAGPAMELPAAVALPVGIGHFCQLRPAQHRLLARARVIDISDRGSFSADVTLENESGELVAAITGVRFAPAQAATFASTASSGPQAYEIIWAAQTAALSASSASSASPNSRAPVPAPAGQGGLWLVFADDGGVGDAAAARLAAVGAEVCLVRARPEMRRIAADQWTLDPAEPSHFSRLLASEALAGREDIRGVVHLWSLDIPCFEAAAGQGVAHDQLKGAGSVLHLTQALAAGGFCGTAGLWLVTAGAQVVTGLELATHARPRAAGVWGLGSVVAVEHPELDVRLVDLDPAGHPDQQALNLVDELLTRGEARRSTAIRDARRWAPRLVRCGATAQSAANHVVEMPPAKLRRPLALQLQLGRAGTLDSLELQECSLPAPGPGEVRLQVAAAGLNFRDVLLALGMYPGAPVPLGAECAGVVCAVGAGVEQFRIGDRVFGFAPASMGTEAIVSADFLAPVPASLGMNEAAAIPVAFLTAWYGLQRLAGIRKGQKVLIHAAAGGVGLAAVQLARRCGAEVFATAGSEQKRTLLKSLGVSHVMDSRSLAFVDEVRRLTSGAGVDIVLNSLADGFIRPSMELVSTGGWFLELGKRGILSAAEATEARPDVHYQAYDLGSEALATPGLVRPMLDLIIEALEDGSLSPLPVTTFGLRQAQDAFRYMAQARHIGKLVLTSDDAGLVRQKEPLVSPGATYWITGGLGGLGLATARWLVDAGARNLVLTGRQAPSAAAKEAVRTMEAAGAHVEVHAADASDRAQMQSVFDAIAASGAPLRGVVHAAGSLDDAMLVNQSWQRCLGVMAGKADGAWLLHELTRTVELDFFVLYSAAGVVLGAPGQGGYAAANAQLDALARVRRLQGLPALSIAWGPWEGVGMAAELANRGIDSWSGVGLGRIAPSRGLDHLRRLLSNGSAYAVVMPIDWPTFLAARAGRLDRDFFKAVASEARSTTAPAPSATTAAQGPAIIARLQAMPAGQRRHAFTDYLRERALQVLGLPSSTPLDAKAPVKECGLDSLMAVELRNLLTRALARPLPATLLFDYPTLEALADYLLRLLEMPVQSGAPSASPAALQGPSPMQALRGPLATAEEKLLRSLSDAEAEVLLLEELDGGPQRKTQ